MDAVLDAEWNLEISTTKLLCGSGKIDGMIATAGTQQGDRAQGRLVAVNFSMPARPSRGAADWADPLADSLPRGWVHLSFAKQSLPRSD
jgi:hypothetical protein